MKTETLLHKLHLFNFTRDLATLRGTEVEYLFVYLRGKLQKTQIWRFIIAMKRFVQNWGGVIGSCVDVLDGAMSESEKELRLRETETALTD